MAIKRHTPLVSEPLTWKKEDFDPRNWKKTASYGPGKTVTVKPRGRSGGRKPLPPEQRKETTTLRLPRETVELADSLAVILKIPRQTVITAALTLQREHMDATSTKAKK